MKTSSDKEVFRDLLAAAKAALVTFQDDELYGMSKNVREVLEKAIAKAEGKS